jgi:hypothetical protein
MTEELSLTEAFDKIVDSHRRMTRIYTESAVEYHNMMISIIDMINMSKDTSVPINTDALILVLKETHTRLGLIEEKYSGKG